MMVYANHLWFLGWRIIGCATLNELLAGHGSVESREAQKLVAQALRRDKDGPRGWEMMKGNNDPYTIQVVLFFNR